MLARWFRYVRPHLLAVPVGVGLAFLVKTVAASGGSCNWLCQPRVYVTMGALGALLGAQLYRSENRLPEEPGRGA